MWEAVSERVAQVDQILKYPAFARYYQKKHGQGFSLQWMLDREVDKLYQKEFLPWLKLRGGKGGRREMGGTVDEMLRDAMDEAQYFGLWDPDVEEIGKFWVVTSPAPEDELGDMCFETNVGGMMLQHKGGLKLEHVRGIYTSRSKAMKHAESLLRLMQSGGDIALRR